MEVRALGQLLDEKNESLRLNCNSLQLPALICWTSYLLILRILASMLHSIGVFPESFHRHMTRIETRIINISFSIIEISSGKSRSSSLTFNRRQRYGHNRDGSFEGTLSRTGPADDLLVVRDSSLDLADQVPEMFLHRPDIAYLRPQAPRHPYHRIEWENYHQASLSWTSSSLRSAVGPTNDYNMQRNNTTVDGLPSPLSVVRPLPRIPVPPISAFIARMPLTSISDSIYSSCSTQPLAVKREDGPVDSSSLERKLPAEPQTYTSLLPKWSFSKSHGSRLDIEKGNISNQSTTGDTPLGHIPGFARSFPNHTRLEAQHNTLAAVTQHYARMNHRNGKKTPRSASAPVARLESP